MKKIFIIFVLSLIFLSCENESTTYTPDTPEEEPSPFIVTISHGDAPDYECPTTAKVIVNIVPENTDIYRVEIFTNKLVKEGEVFNVRYRIYCPAEYLDYPAGWSEYYDFPFTYRDQLANKHKYTGSYSVSTNKQVIEISGTITAEDGTTCDIGTFRVGSADYIDM